MATVKVKAPKVKWHLSPAPAGRYKSFERRGWPYATYVMPDGSDKNALRIDADGDDYRGDYTPLRAKSGDHIPLTVCIAAYDENNKWVWRKLKQRFLTLDKAKAGGEMAIISYQEFWPLEIRPAPKEVEVKPKPPAKSKKINSI